MAITRRQILEIHRRSAQRCRAILRAKGHDYSSHCKEDDTLFSVRVGSLLGITNSPIDDALIYCAHKLSRLISLTRPGVVRQVEDETLENTVDDLKNYLDFVVALVEERQGKL